MNAEAIEQFCAGCYRCPNCECIQACDFREKSAGHLHNCLNCGIPVGVGRWILVREYDQAGIDTFFPTVEIQREKKRKAVKDSIDVLVQHAMLDGFVTGDQMTTWMREAIQEHG